MERITCPRQFTQGILSIAAIQAADIFVRFLDDWTVLSMLTLVCHLKKVMHRGWAYFQARLAFTMATFNILVQWHGFQPYRGPGFDLSLADTVQGLHILLSDRLHGYTTHPGTFDGLTDARRIIGIIFGSCWIPGSWMCRWRTT
jgi:hypothetical protein